MKQRWIIAIIFVIGCATGSVASQLVVPPVRAGTSPARWEYLCGEVDADALTAQLNKLGAEGWDLVTQEASRTRPVNGATTTLGIGFCAKRALL